MSKPKRKLNKDYVKAKISNLIENGRKEITTKEELEQFPIGSLISYMNKNNEFKIAGFITKFSDDYFIYIVPDFTQKYRVRYTNVIKMWVGDVYSVKKDIISFTKTSKNKTDFPVKLNNVILYYAKHNFDKKRYMNTNKYEISCKWIDYFNI